MSHEIDTTTGKAACFVTKEPAWHRLGKVIREAATSAEAIKLAGLDWTIEQWELQAHAVRGGESQTANCPSRVANVRTDTNAVLGVVGRSYRVFQNAEAFDFMDGIVGEKLAMYETAGALKGGKRIWMLARIPKEYRVGEDVVKPYVLLTNTHDGSRALRMLPTTVRVVCNNTLSLALGQSASHEGLSIYHWPKLESRVTEARKKLGVISSRLDQFGEEMQALSDRKLSAAETKDYFRGLFPTQTQAADHAQRGMSIDETALLDRMLDVQQEEDEVVDDLLAGHYAATEAQGKRNAKILESVLANYEGERNTLPGIKHSAWSAFNSVSEWADHEKTVRGKGQAERDENRVNSIWFGSANKVKQEAYAAALDLVK